MIDTLPALLAWRADASPGASAYVERQADGSWLAVSWHDFAARVERVRCGLLAAGLRRGDRLALIAPVSLQWELIHHAALAIGAAVVGMDAHDLPRRIGEMADQVGVVAFAVVDAAVLREVSVRRLADARFVLLVGDRAEGHSTGARVVHWSALEALGASGQPVSADRAVAPDDEATIIFTSGTTGRPRGIAYTHAQVCLAVDSICQAFSFVDASGRLLCWLPLSNLFQRIVNLAAVRQGAVTYLLGDPRQVMQVLPLVSPDIFVGVPRFYEKLIDGVNASIEGQPPLRRWLARRAWAVGRRMSGCRLAGTSPGLLLRLEHAVAERLVLRRLRGIMGSRLRLMVSGSAPLGTSVLLEFHALGWLVLEAYGLSENIVPMAMNRLDDFCFGSVGRPVPSSDIVIGDDGVIRVRGPGLFRGYLDDPQGSPLDAAGYFTTGDLGAWDEHGHLRLVGRASEVFKTSTGRRVAPAPVEAALREVPGIDQVMVVGAGRKFPVALCTLATGGLDEPARSRLAESLRQAAVVLPEHERPRGVVLLAQAFSIDRGELTSNLKLRRAAIEQLHAASIEALYQRIGAPTGGADDPTLLVL